MPRKTTWLRVPLFIAGLALIIWWWWHETERKTEPAAGLMGARPKPPGPPEPRTHSYPHPVAHVPPSEPVPEGPPTESEPALEPIPPAPEAAESEAQTEPARQDNLKRIEGIGPKIESVFKAAGILSFAQLAETETARLEEILADAEIRIADPTTWPEQAALAAAEDWQGLELLQSQLKGGRRVAQGRRPRDS